ncbi:MAG TPA: response regulator transcription factor [Spirochaetota bacterium]|nr:response regulator transcription factor [Spirochaetota bacterium]HPF07059.1 response regulator transcription factor [Spirochaetota bacterium]HPJ43331.1 response regulator transcription factor [Spirochaetota bacterium]HPR38581.1 response regulator transcription factor [Spirochaetota bacterium]HRX48494.1 response regulator transcription factor [Spirochaetota bacterium]
MDTKILIIDDDSKLRGLITEYLSSYGFSVISHDSGNGVLPAIVKHTPDLILLDYMLPGKDGIEVLREIRGVYTLPVIMLTARGDETDRIVGLELGADDYIAKPFNTRELLARIKAVLRRYNPENGEAAGESIHKITVDGLTLAPSTMTIEYNNKSEELSKTEFRIMEALIKNPNTVLSRDTIMNIAKGRDAIAFERSIDVHISKLRTKLEKICGDKLKIKTVWGTGYMFTS